MPRNRPTTRKHAAARGRRERFSDRLLNRLGGFSPRAAQQPCCKPARLPALKNCGSKGGGMIRSLNFHFQAHFRSSRTSNFTVGAQYFSSRLDHSRLLHFRGPLELATYPAISLVDCSVQNFGSRKPEELDVRRASKDLRTDQHSYTPFTIFLVVFFS